MEAEPLDQGTFDAGRLVRDHPPRWCDGNKRLVFEIGCSSGFPFEGEITYARWPARELPTALETRPQFLIREGVFEYAVPTEPAKVAWHVNFADPTLFVAYESSLLAQDELQVAEHPVLGSLREAQDSKGKVLFTIDGRGEPTPVTITGVQRRCSIDTRPNQRAGRTGGLYGAAFGRAPAEHVAAATKALSPPSISNVLAMSAPFGGDGEYNRGEIVHILRTAYTGFSAAYRESGRMVPTGAQPIIHTGFWGCGVFGGNRTLMVILQALAADLAGVEIGFWAVDTRGVELAEEARRRYKRMRETTASVARLCDDLVQQKFEWGVSDGN